MNIHVIGPYVSEDYEQHLDILKLLVTRGVSSLICGLMSQLTIFQLGLLLVECNVILRTNLA